MLRVLHGFLFLAVTFAYVLGSHVVIEFEHSHEKVAGHPHHHPNESGKHGDPSHSHGHDPVPLSEDPENGDHDDEPRPHSHVTTLGADAPFIAPAVAHLRALAPTGVVFLFPEPDACPDSPCFSLIKPPQLG